MLGSLGRGELGDSELVTLLDAGGHGVASGGGEFGCKRPLLGVLMQDWGGLGTIDGDWEPGPGGHWLDHGGSVDDVLRQDRGGLGTIDWDWEPGPGGHWLDRGCSLDDGLADGRRREERHQRLDRGLVTGCSGHCSVDLGESNRNA